MRMAVVMRKTETSEGAKWWGWRRNSLLCVGCWSLISCRLTPAGKGFHLMVQQERKALTGPSADEPHEDALARFVKWNSRCLGPRGHARGESPSAAAWPDPLPGLGATALGPGPHGTLR